MEAIQLALIISPDKVHEVRDNYKATLLHYACLYNKPGIVAMLLAYDADVNAVDTVSPDDHGSDCYSEQTRLRHAETTRQSQQDSQSFTDAHTNSDTQIWVQLPKTEHKHTPL